MSILSSLSYVLFGAWGLIVVKTMYVIGAGGLIGEHAFRKVRHHHGQDATDSVPARCSLLRAASIWWVRHAVDGSG
jgi:hypothetical protein